jgi:hypothetical protein
MTAGWGGGVARVPPPSAGGAGLADADTAELTYQAMTSARQLIRLRRILVIEVSFVSRHS